MAKRGRPKNTEDKNNIFVGLQMPRGLAESLSGDAGKNFRMRSQHILWILTDYLKNVPKETVNEPLYTKEELDDMYKEHKENL